MSKTTRDDRFDSMTAPDRPAAGTSRRTFLRGGSAIGLAASLGLPACAEAPMDPAKALESGRTKLRSDRRRLGRTDLEIPPVSFGTFLLRGETELVRHALDLGITHFDTAPDYMDGDAEATLGRALGRDRERVTITTKHIAPADASVDFLMETLEKSLSRLATDRIDLYLNHAVDDFDRLRSPSWAEFVERAKQAGKIRYAGISGHGPSLTPILREAIEAGQIDALLAAYNYIQSPSFLSRAKIRLQQLTGRLDWVALQPELPGVLAEAKARGIGVMTMKTLRGARHNDMRPFEHDGNTFAQAAIRWTLSDENIDGLVIGMTSAAQIDEYVAALAPDERPADDLALLLGYVALNHTRQCVAGCGDCLDRCPAGVDVPTTLRLAMYARDYGAPALAQSRYATAGFPAEACLSCDGTPCANACANGVDIAHQTRSAHRRLTSA